MLSKALHVHLSFSEIWGVTLKMETVPPIQWDPTPPLLADQHTETHRKLCFLATGLVWLKDIFSLHWSCDQGWERLWPMANFRLGSEARLSELLWVHLPSSNLSGQCFFLFSLFSSRIVDFQCVQWILSSGNSLFLKPHVWPHSVVTWFNSISVSWQIIPWQKRLCLLLTL